MAAIDEATLKLSLYEDEDEPNDLQGYLSSEDDFQFKKVHGDQYYIPNGTVFKLGPEDDKSLTAVKSTEEAAQQEMAYVPGVLSSKEQVTLIPKDDGGVYFIVPKKTLFSFLTESGQRRTFILEKRVILHKDSSHKFTVSVKGGVPVREVKAELSVVLTYYFQEMEPHFDPENIKTRLNEDFCNEGFKPINVYDVILDQTSSSTTKLIGLSVTIYGSYKQPFDVQESLQEYFNDPDRNLKDRDRDKDKYKVLPPPHWVIRQSV